MSNKKTKKVLKPLTKIELAKDLCPNDLIVDDIDHENKIVWVFPVWSVTWCDCWYSLDKAYEPKKKLSGYYDSKGKLQYDAWYGDHESEVDPPHSLMCRFENNYKSKVHIKVQSFSHEFMSDIYHRAYSKTNKVETLQDKMDYTVEAVRIGSPLFLDYKDMMDTIADVYEKKHWGWFEDWFYDVEKMSLAEIQGGLIHDAEHYRNWLSQFPEERCSYCWNKYDKNGIDMWNLPKLTQSQMVEHAIKMRIKFFPMNIGSLSDMWDDEGKWKDNKVLVDLFKHFDDKAHFEKYIKLEYKSYERLLSKAKKGKATKKDYFTTIYGKDVRIA